MAEKVMKEFSSKIYSKFMLMSPGDSFDARNQKGELFTFRRENHPTGEVTIRKKEEEDM